MLACVCVSVEGSLWCELSQASWDHRGQGHLANSERRSSSNVNNPLGCVANLQNYHGRGRSPQVREESVEDLGYAKEWGVAWITQEPPPRLGMRSHEGEGM